MLGGLDVGGGEELLDEQPVNSRVTNMTSNLIIWLSLRCPAQARSRRPEASMLARQS
jgi:hypothetical protein